VNPLVAILAILAWGAVGLVIFYWDTLALLITLEIVTGIGLAGWFLLFGIDNFD
jgi:hypothetical protein